MDYTIIAAMANNQVIGKNGKIPWHCLEDLKHFKKLILNHPIIMGRKTYESIHSTLGSVLPKRQNIVLTRSPFYSADNADIVHSLESMCKLLEDTNHHKKDIDYSTAYIIGGQSVYEQTLPFVDRLELTFIHDTYDGDTFFPKLDYGQWDIEKYCPFLKYSFMTYVRKKKEFQK